MKENLQLKWMNKKRALGLCRQCGKPREDKDKNCCNCCLSLDRDRKNLVRHGR